jgi:multidrug resistance efflux pump
LKVLETEVAERTKLVARTEKALERLAFMADDFLPGGENDPLKQALAVEEDKIRIFEGKMAPLRLAAPINGVVTMIHRRAGEQIRAGESLVTITSKDATRINGYLPEGFAGEPCIGMEIEVCTRGFNRRKGIATLLGISPNLQSITNNLVAPLAVRPTVIPSLARTLSVSLPAGLALVPGQPVDMRFRKKLSREITPP